MQLRITPKQAEYRREAHHRWNLAVGAVRSGKSHMAVQYIIPKGVMSRHGKKGINLILGATKENIERNVLMPMRDIWGDSLVSQINSRNQAMLFGELCYCIGAENARQVSKIRGSEVKFCYCDELADIHPDVFDILKSRLSLGYSEFHGACNPASPKHFVKQFIDSAKDGGIDLYCQHYTIYDNPFLPSEYVSAIEAEYRGTVYYDRYIKGLWTQAEGLVYPNFEAALEDAWEDVGTMASAFCVSCDYGTQNAFAALKWARDGSGCWHMVDEYYYSGRTEGKQKTDADYVEDMLAFCNDIPGRVEFIVDPSAASFIEAMRRSAKFSVVPADNNVPDGLRDTSVCMQNGSIKISRDCKSVIDEIQGYVWDEGKDDLPVKENDHAMDALRYFVKTKKVYRPPTQYVSPFGM